MTLAELQRAADEFLREQPSGRALCPCAEQFWRRRFCLPTWLVEAIERDALAKLKIGDSE